MRLTAVLVLALMLAPVAISTEGEPRDALVVSIYEVDGTGALVAWEAAPNAVSYNVFRGPTPDDITFVGSSTSTLFLDGERVEGDVWYVVVSVHAGSVPLATLGNYKGACVAHRGMTGVSVTAAHCLPARPI